MLAADPTLTQPTAAEIGHIASLIAGGVAALAYARWLWRSGQWRRPLADRRPAAAPLPLEYAVLAIAGPMLLYVLVASAAQQFLMPALEPEALAAALGRLGSDAWHRGQVADALGRLAAVGLLIVLLRAQRTFDAPAPPPLKPAGLLRVVAAGVLIMTTLSLLLLGLMLWGFAQFGVQPPQHPVLDALHHSDWDVWGRLQLTASAVAVAPLTEELLFRGVILQLAWRLSGRAWSALLAQSVLFGLIHLSVPATVPPLVLLGLMLGYVRLRTGSLTACVLIHALFNGRTMLLAWVAPEMLET